MNKYIEKNSKREYQKHKRIVRSLECLSYINNKKNPWLKRILLTLYKEILLWIFYPQSTFRREVICRLGFHKFSWQHYELERISNPGSVIIKCDICSKTLGTIPFDDLPTYDLKNMIYQVQDLKKRKMRSLHC